MNHEISFINLLNSLENWKQYDIIEENISKNLLFELRKKEYREYRMENAVYSREELIRTANKWFLKYLAELEDKKIKVLDNQVRLKITEKKCVAAGSLYVSEPVCTYRKITDSEWRKIENDEYRGSSN